MLSRVSLLAVATLFQSGVTPALADELTFATYGGSWGAAISKVGAQPIAHERNLTVTEVTLNSLNEIKIQVDAGAVAIDVIDVTGLDCAIGAKQGIFEPIDYATINKDGLNPLFIKPDWIGGPSYTSTVLAYNTDKYKDNAPQTWTDFWNIEKFPGTRALWNTPYQMLEVALLADGVKKEELYPLDVERALKKLREIKPFITVWWTSGGQAAQLLNDGEIDMLAIWNGRASTVIDAGAQASFTYNQGLLGNDCLAVPKGAKNKATAMQFIGDLLSPDIQAAIPGVIDYGPVNTKAFNTGLITPDQMKSINSSNENLALQLNVNDEWWAENLATIQPLWDAFIQE